jgi:hypothetical protein
MMSRITSGKSFLTISLILVLLLVVFIYVINRNLQVSNDSTIFGDMLSQFQRNNPKTRLVQTYTIADLTELKLFENICLDDAGLIFLDDEAAKTNRQFLNHDGISDLADAFNLFRGAKKPGAILPASSAIRGRYGESTLFQSPMRDCTVLIVLSDWSGANIFHWSIKVIPAWEFTVNTQLCLTPELLLHRNPTDYHEWQKEFTKGLFGVTDAKVELHANLPTRCFKRLLVTGTNIAGVSAPNKALQMRTQINTYLGYNLKFGLEEIVYVHRSSRSVENYMDLVRYMEGVTKHPIKVVNFDNMSFKEQFQVMSSCAILVTMHGAGLTNSMFMPTGSSVIEIVNPRFIISIYDRMVVNSGLYHMRYLAKLSEVVSPPQNPVYAGWSSSRCIPDPSCSSLSKNINLRVDIDEFAVIFRQAVSASWSGEVSF